MCDDLEEASKIRVASKRWQTCHHLEQGDRSSRHWWRTGRDVGTRPTTHGPVEGNEWAEYDVSSGYDAWRDES